MFLRMRIGNIMKNYYDKMNGYQEIIQKGLRAAKTVGRNISMKTGSKEENIERLRKELEHAEAVIIGAGAGLSISAGLTYSGARFEKLFLILSRSMVSKICIRGDFTISMLRKQCGRGGQGIFITTVISNRQRRYTKICFQSLRIRNILS